MANIVLGVFDSRDNASKAIDDLRSAGYSSDQISLVTRDTAELREWRELQDADVAGDTAKGAIAGGAVGALAGLLLGVGAITLPPLGGVLIAGPLAGALGISTAGASALAGAGLGAAGGGIIGALTNLGISPEEAEIYQRLIIDEGILLGVDENMNSENKASEILRQNGAEEVRIVESVDSLSNNSIPNDDTDSDLV